MEPPEDAATSQIPVTCPFVLFSFLFINFPPVTYGNEGGRVRGRDSKVRPTFHFFHFLLLTIVSYHDSPIMRATRNQRDRAGPPSGCSYIPTPGYVYPSLFSFFWLLILQWSTTTNTKNGIQCDGTMGTPGFDSEILT